MVAASRATPTPATAHNPYLYAQIYTGLMYMMAAGCAWLLRAWKIGQLEMLAQGKGEIDAVVDCEMEKGDVVRAGRGIEGRMYKSSLLHRLFVFKRV